MASFITANPRARSGRDLASCRLDLIRPSMGALWDALWLQSSRWYSLRLFGRHWRMALAAIVSLSVAIAATVIGFASYNALLLRPPGVNDPGSLLLIHAQTATEPYGQVSYAEYSDYITRTHVFSEIAAFPYSHLQHRLQNRRHVARARCGDPGLEQLLPRARRHSSPGRADTQGFAVRRRRRYRSEQRVLEEAGIRSRSHREDSSAERSAGHDRRRDADDIWRHDPRSGSRTSGCR